MLEWTTARSGRNFANSRGIAEKSTLPRTKVPLDAEAEKLFLRAMEEFLDNGRTDDRCDACGSPISFRETSDPSWEHSCDCGKFNGTLSGL